MRGLGLSGRGLLLVARLLLLHGVELGLQGLDLILQQLHLRRTLGQGGCAAEAGREGQEAQGTLQRSKGIFHDDSAVLPAAWKRPRKSARIVSSLDVSRVAAN